jgi:hypothetical protein
MTPEQKLQRLEALVKAAQELDRGDDWRVESLLTQGYPRSLPSFDELVADLVEWRDTVRGYVAR